MAERPVRKASLWRKAANAAMVAGLAGCQLAERIGYITPPPEGTKTNPAETTLPPTEKEIEATSTETSTPAIIATEVRPAAKGTDELSIKIQNYLNSYYSELGISEAEEKSQPVSVEGGGLFVFAESRYGKEDKRLPLLIEIGMDLSLKNVWLLERNGNYSGGDVLVKYEYLAYSFEEGGKNVLLLQGPAVLRLKTGEFKIFFDNNWRTAQSPSERHIEPLKELLTGEDYARPSGDYIVITPKPQPTEVIEANPPLVQPESLEVKLDGKLLESLRKVDEKKLTKNPHYQTTFDSATIIAPYAEEAEKLIALMGVSGNPDLVQMYRDFFDSQWVISPWYKDSRFDIRGLGSEAFETISVEGNEGLTSFQDVGFFYGFTQAGGERYMILQIVPGSTLTPESHPEAFIATNISGGYLGLRDIKEWGKAEEQYPVKLNKREPYARYWTAKELKDLFNLKRGTIVSTVGAGMNSGYYYAYYMYIQMNEFPGEEEQTGKYKLKGFGSW